MVAVFSSFKKKSRADAEPPLTSPSTGPRVKTYSAASGYVYQYAFVGQRIREREIEYVFEISFDRTTRHRVSVWVADSALRPWTETNGRELTSSERYGVAKIALRNAFDEREKPEAIHERIAPGAEEVIAILEELDV